MYNEPQPKFMQFNYGAEYDLEAVRAPVVLMSGGRDVLSSKVIATARAFIHYTFTYQLP
jgi:hypothetical protein